MNPAPARVVVPLKAWIGLVTAACAVGGGTAAAVSPKDYSGDIATLKAQEGAAAERDRALDARLDRIESKLDRLIERAK